MRLTTDHCQCCLMLKPTSALAAFYERDWPLYVTCLYCEITYSIDSTGDVSVFVLPYQDMPRWKQIHKANLRAARRERSISE